MASKPEKKSWDEEMADLIQQYKPGEEQSRISEKDVRLYKFWDINQKYLFLVKNMLLADSQTSSSPAHLIAVLPNTSLDPKQKPIFMGTEHKKYSLSCVKSGDGQYRIELKEKHIKELYHNPESGKAFTFYSRSDGKPETCSFESAEFPGWFLCTSSEPKKPIGLSQKGGPGNILFYFERKS